MKTWPIFACVGLITACGQVDSSAVSVPSVTTQSAEPVTSEVLFDIDPQYEGGGVFAPFSPMRRWMRSAPVVDTVTAAVDDGPLHSLGLDAMRYVGYLQRGVKRVALLEVAGAVFSVRVGDRIGVEGARVRNIGERALSFYLPLNGEGARAVALPELRMESE